MTTAESATFARCAEAIYELRLKGHLEAAHRDEFVAIEPDSGEYFLGHTLSEAIGKARQAYPERVAYAVRIGHRAAVHLGILS